MSICRKFLKFTKAGKRESMEVIERYTILMTLLIYKFN